jgi:hypothetical protein
MYKINANYILLQFVDHIYWVNHFSTFHPKFNFKNAKYGHFITQRSHTILSILEFLSDFVSRNCQKWFCSLISLQLMCPKAIIFFVLSYFSPSKGLIISKHLSELKYHISLIKSEEWCWEVHKFFLSKVLHGCLAENQNENWNFGGAVEFIQIAFH